jgi:hypothetical protein
VQTISATVDGATRNVCRILCTSGGTGIFGVNQRVESKGIPVGVELTMSCWVRTNNPYVGFRTNTIGASSRDLGDKVPADGNWHKLEYTINNTGTVSEYHDVLIVAYNNASVSIATNDYIEVADVQLELGKVATPFEHRSYGEELALCQRYYEKSTPQGIFPTNGPDTTSFGSGLSDNLRLVSVAVWSQPTMVPFKVEKRVNPTMTYYGNSQGYWGYLSTGTSGPSGISSFTFHANVYRGANTKGVFVNNQVSTSPMWQVAGHWAADAEL